ncbi:hypothetical protein B7755_004100 [Streptomyces sp. NBS 14/10]|uniref:hypothetical protein n=1 Tax=Streptomyces sp. NBS 14/10 TaxID=1945643 RepID=UPI00211ACBF5|nr:hypothetical protein [Streptomyces sp. NBS 14/10]KAK1177411.1 hypothetical protein B7755_004100 [Streptomyces sp. NBS 14/10]
MFCYGSKVSNRLVVKGAPPACRCRPRSPAPRKGEHADIFRQLSADGFSRVRVDGRVHALATPPALDKRKKHSIDVVVDRVAVKPGVRQRLTESVETALGLAGTG